MDVQDLENVQAFIGNMSAARQAEIESLGLNDIANRALAGMQQNGFDVASLEDSLAGLNANLGRVSASISDEAATLEALSTSLNQLLSDPQMLADLSGSLGRTIQQVGLDLQMAAEAIAFVVASGVGVDLEAVAQGAGFSSFAEAVAAYNEANGTNYTVEQAKDALGL